MLFGPQHRVHSGRIPDHCDWLKIKEIFDYVQTQWALLLRKAAVGRPGSREDRLCAHCPQNEVETELHFLTFCQMYDHIRDTYFPQVTQIHIEFENKSNFDKLPYLLGEIPVWHHSSKMCDLLPQDNGNQWRTHTIVNTTHIDLFSLLYFNHLYIVTTLYIYI